MTPEHLHVVSQRGAQQGAPETLTLSQDELQEQDWVLELLVNR